MSPQIFGQEVVLRRAALQVESLIGLYNRRNNTGGQRMACNSQHRERETSWSHLEETAQELQPESFKRFWRVEKEEEIHIIAGMSD